MSITDAQLAEWEALCGKATGGPWHTSGPDSVAQWMIYDDEWCVATATAYGHNLAYGGSKGPSYIDSDANAAFIAASRTALPALLAEVRRLRQEISDHQCGHEWCGYDAEDL